MYARDRVHWSTDARCRTPQATAAGVLRRRRSPAEWTRGVTKHPSVRRDMRPDDRRHSGLDLGSRRSARREIVDRDLEGEASLVIETIRINRDINPRDISECSERDPIPVHLTLRSFQRRRAELLISHKFSQLAQYASIREILRELKR